MRFNDQLAPIIISLKAESDRTKKAAAIAVDTSLDKATIERKIENHIATKDYHSYVTVNISIY